MANWGLLQPVDIGGAFNRGMELGVQFRREKAIDDAFRTMAQNPNAPVSNDLLQNAPQMAYQVSQQQRAAQQQAQQRQTRIDAVSGNPQAVAQLAGDDFEAYKALSKEQRDEAERAWDVIGQVALAAETPEIWDNYVDQLGPAFASYKGRFDMRMGVIAQAKQMKEYLAQIKPDYQVIPEGGTLVNTRDPAALQRVANQNTSAVNMADLEAQAQAAIAAGADPEKVRARLQELGGAASNGGGNFPGWY